MTSSATGGWLWQGAYKIHEEIVRGTVEEIIKAFEGKKNTRRGYDNIRGVKKRGGAEDRGH